MPRSGSSCGAKRCARSRGHQLIQSTGQVRKSFAPASMHDAIAARTRDEWGEIFDREGVWWARVQHTHDLVDDPQAIAARGFVAMPLPDDRAFLDRMPGSSIPVLHQPFAEGDHVPFWALTRFSGAHLYDRLEDPDETTNLAGGPHEAEMAALLAQALAELEAPKSQFQRLGL